MTIHADRDTSTDDPAAKPTDKPLEAPARPTIRSRAWMFVCRLAGCEVDAPAAKAPAEPGVVFESSKEPAAVLADRLTKTYSGGVTAARDVSLRAEAGEIVAVVGPNGAGKSTTLNMISGLLHPTGGSATVADVPTTDTKRLGVVLGVALQTSGLDPAMTGLEHFEVQGALYGLSRTVAAQRTKTLIETFGLTPYANRQASQYSIGLQRRLVLALALVHEPQVLVLDEPTAGLDPQSRRMVWEMLEQLREQGRTIIFSTQLLEEADMLAQRIYVISDGQVVAEGSPAQLRRTFGEQSIRVRVPGSLDPAEAALAGLPMLGDPRRDGDSLVYTVGDANPDVTAVATRLAEAGIDHLEIAVGRPSLEDAFVKLTGEGVRVEPLLTMGSNGGPLCRCS
jgi:ABC-2 type transport system ATP-binding protein